MSNENNFGSFVMGFTVGALAGAIASLLLAPLKLAKKPARSSRKKQLS